MPVYEITSPEGKTYEVTAPEGATEQDALSYVQNQIAQDAQPQPQQEKPLEWSDVPGEALSNTPSSAYEFGKGIYQAVRHPLDTAGAILDAGAGGLKAMIPEPVAGAIESLNWNPEATQRAESTASNIGQFYKQRYGGMENLKQTLAKDPVGALADASAVLTAGGSAVAQAPGTIGRIGQGIQTAGQAANPLSIAGKVAKPVLKGAGIATSNLIGGLGTHTGAESVKQAASAGYRGGKAARSFQDNLRGNVPITDVLDDARANLTSMKIAKNNQYRSGLLDISKDKSVLGFGGVDDAIKTAKGNVSFKGQVKSVRAADTIAKIEKEVAKWKKLNPKEFHTPEGLDALKQKVGDLVESIPFEEKTARMAGNNIYRAIKNEISKQAPTYSKVMKGYSQATDQIKEAEKALSLGGKASADTALRKLQSIMRNNANTNYGKRVDIARQLEAQGGREIMPALAGQAMNSWTPRGLGGLVAGGAGLAGIGTLNPAFIPVMLGQSPRLMGEAAYYAGKAAKPVSKFSQAASPYGPALYELGLLNERNK
jgi:hypothetical protein